MLLLAIMPTLCRVRMACEQEVSGAHAGAHHDHHAPHAPTPDDCSSACAYCGLLAQSPALTLPHSLASLVLFPAPHFDAADVISTVGALRFFLAQPRGPPVLA
jgi:hypothetical protein